MRRRKESALEGPLSDQRRKEIEAAQIYGIHMNHEAEKVYRHASGEKLEVSEPERARIPFAIREEREKLDFQYLAHLQELIAVGFGELGKNPELALTLADALDSLLMALRPLLNQEDKQNIELELRKARAVCYKMKVVRQLAQSKSASARIPYNPMWDAKQAQALRSLHNALLVLMHKYGLSTRMKEDEKPPDALEGLFGEQ